MRIKLFNKLLAQEAQDHVLKDCSLVIDGHNYLYNSYERSRLSNTYGCESDRFAKFLKNQLSMFKKTNIKCYFVFKGGSKDVEKRWEKKTSPTRYDDQAQPIFMKDICRQVLEEMGFDYVICQLEAKEQCAVLASVLQCPVISNDIEVGILSSSYVNHLKLIFNTASNIIECKLLHFNTFLEKYKLCRDKFSIFVLLTDETIYPEKYFSKVLKEIKAPESLLEQYLYIFKWVSSKSKSEIMNQIVQGFNTEEKDRILRKEKEVHAHLTSMSPGIPCQYFLESNRISVTDNDSKWFEKGIASRYIAIPYINLYTDGVVDGSWVFKEAALPDAILLSADMIKYALNLLSNYSRDSFTIRRDNGIKIEVSTKMPDVPKPEYTVSNVIFENGWSRIEQLNLFKHFLSHTIVGVDIDPLLKLPKDARLLMLAMIYMAHKSETWGEREAYSVMLSFVALCGNNIYMKQHDRQTAAKALTPYFFKEQTINKDLIYPLFQFQHCLEQMNYLNALCCFSYQPTVYHRTYNAKYVYNILIKINVPEIDAFVYSIHLLRAAPTVANYFKILVDTYKKIMPFNH